MPRKRKSSEMDYVPEEQPSVSNVRGRKQAQLTIGGQLSCHSHVLHTKPECMILELCSGRSVLFVIITIQNQFLWVEDLTIGMYYTVSNVTETVISHSAVKDCSGKYYRTSLNSKILSNDLEESVSIPEHPDLVTILNLEVTKADDELGLYELNNSSTLITSTLKSVARIPTLKVGDSANVYNVHKIILETGETYLIMCSRGFLSINEKNHMKRVFNNPYSFLSSVLKHMSKRHRGFKNIMWLQQCREFIKENFASDFLLGIGVNAGEENAFRSNLLLNIVKLVFISPHQSQSIMQEVLAQNHSCDPMDQNTCLYSFQDFNKLFSSDSSLEAMNVADDDANFWRHSMEESEKNTFLLGYICVKNSSHRLTLRNSKGSIVCIFSESSSITKNLLSYHQKIVLIWKHHLVIEKFMWNEKGKKTQDWRYILVSPEHVNILSPADNINIAGTLSDQGNQRSDSPKVYNFNSIRVDMTCHNILPTKPHLQEYWSQLVLVQHKPSISVPGVSQAARSIILVSMLGGAVKHSDPVKVRNNEGSPAFICLKGPLLSAYHFISVDQVYEIRIPLSFGPDFFNSRFPLVHLQSMESLLPTIECVNLPSGSEIFYVDSQNIPTYKLHYGDCYRVPDAVCHGANAEFISLTGFVVSRIHEKARYPRELQSVDAHGFGVAGCRIITLHICDQTPGSPVLESITVILSFWTHSQYPLALLPGAKINLRFLNKVVPKIVSTNTSVYFRASVLTSVDIVEFPSCGDAASGDSQRITQPDQWGERCTIKLLLNKNRTGWISLSMMTLLRFSIIAFCKSCGHEFARNSCLFVGCSAKEEPSFVAQATLWTSDFNIGTVLIGLSNKHVREFLQIPDEIWNALTVCAKSMGRLLYNHNQKLLEGEERNVVDETLKLFCRTALYGRRVHMLCRSFRFKNYGTALQPLRKSVPMLFCVDFREILIA